MGKPTRRSTRTTNSTKAPLPPPVKSAAVETVAILTPTHRFDVLDLCLDRIASQTILNRIEAWVLVDGSKHADAHVWSSVLGSLRRRCRQDSALKHLTIVDGSALVKPPRNIAAYRNATLEAAARETSAAYFINFDDDDMYVPLRCESAVAALRLGRLANYDLAGCSNHLVSDPDLEVGNRGLMFQYRVFSPFHCTANTLACARRYVDQGHRYAAGQEEGSGYSFAEEQHFLDKYSQGMVQIPAHLCCLQSAHLRNTFLKRNQMMGGLSHYLKLTKEPQSCYVSAQKLEDLVPRDVYDAYMDRLWPNLNDGGAVDADVTFYLGHRDPFSLTCPGGANGVFLHTARALAAAGRSVRFYANFPQPFSEQSDVDGRLVFEHSTRFRVSATYQTLVLGRPAGILPLLHVRLKAARLVLDPQDFVHSSFLTALRTACHVENHVHKLVVRSQHQLRTLRDAFAEHFAHWEPRLMHVPRGGANPDARAWALAPSEALERRPHAFVFLAHWSKGLEATVRYQWPILRRNFPAATLDVLQPLETKAYASSQQLPAALQTLLQRQPGVTFHGHLANRQDVQRVLHRASWLLYFTACPVDMAGTAIYDAAVAGVVPLLSQQYIYSELPGLGLPGDPTTPDGHQQASAEMVRIVAAGAYATYASRLQADALKATYDVVGASWDAFFRAPSPPKAPRKKLKAPVLL